MRLRTLLIIALGAAAAGCARHSAEPDLAEAELTGPRTTVVSYRTPDGWTIRGDFQSPKGASRAVVLLHQRNGNARDWALLVPRLAAAGIATLAIDQRGAGRSRRDGDQADAPWDTSGDIAGAIAWLGAKGFARNRIGLAGASYGANNVLLYAARTPGTPAIALLSPGTDYHGLAIRQAAGAYRGPLLLLYSKDDPITEGGPELIVQQRNGALDSAAYPGSSHGTDIFSHEPGAITTTALFFDRHLPKR